MIKTFFMNAIRKIIDHLVMRPHGIDFDLKIVNEKRYDGEMMEEIFITINVDDSKIISNSENYDEAYATSITDYLEDRISDSLKYIGKSDTYVNITYNHFNTSFLNEIEKDMENLVKDYMLRAAQEDQTKYLFNSYIDISSRAPHLFFIIESNLPDNRQKELWYKLVDEHGYDDFVIEFEEY